MLLICSKWNLYTCRPTTQGFKNLCVFYTSNRMVHFSKVKKETKNKKLIHISQLAKMTFPSVKIMLERILTCKGKIAVTLQGTWGFPPTVLELSPTRVCGGVLNVLNSVSRQKQNFIHQIFVERPLPAKHKQNHSKPRNRLHFLRIQQPLRLRFAHAIAPTLLQGAS